MFAACSLETSPHPLLLPPVLAVSSYVSHIHSYTTEQAQCHRRGKELCDIKIKVVEWKESVQKALLLQNAEQRTKDSSSGVGRFGHLVTHNRGSNRRKDILFPLSWSLLLSWQEETILETRKKLPSCFASAMGPCESPSTGLQRPYLFRISWEQSLARAIAISWRGGQMDGWMNHQPSFPFTLPFTEAREQKQYWEWIYLVFSGQLSTCSDTQSLFRCLRQAAASRS